MAHSLSSIRRISKAGVADKNALNASRAPDVLFCTIHSTTGGTPMRQDIRYNNIIDGEEARTAQASADRAANLPADQIHADEFYITQCYDKYTR
ncbi:MAG: hypothetical protein WC718_11035, partial [Phycisphaerales bacterium]